jgi:hypothetical protein
MSLEAMPAPAQSETSGLTMGVMDPDDTNDQEMDAMAKYMASLV